MKKKAYIFMIILTVLISKNINAQDIIFLKSGDKIDSKILEVNIDNIKYKKYSNQNGPIFVIPKKDILKLAYENGESDIFNEETSNKEEPKEFRKNRINIDVLAFTYNGPISVSYERLNENGKIGYEIPLNLHMAEGEFMGITTGLNLKYYISGRAKGFYVGPSLALGVFDYGFLDYDYVFSVIPGAKLGYQFQLSNLFGLSLGGTVGYVLPIDSNYQGDIAYSINFGLNFSLRKK